MLIIIGGNRELHNNSQNTSPSKKYIQSMESIVRMQVYFSDLFFIFYVQEKCFRAIIYFGSLGSMQKLNIVRNGTTINAQIFLSFPVLISSKQAKTNKAIRSIQLKMISMVFTNDDYSIQPLMSFQLMSVGSGAYRI